MHYGLFKVMLTDKKLTIKSRQYGKRLENSYIYKVNELKIPA
jgi:hypothetical protein